MALTNLRFFWLFVFLFKLWLVLFMAWTIHHEPSLIPKFSRVFTHSLEVNGTASHHHFGLVHSQPSQLPFSIGKSSITWGYTRATVIDILLVSVDFQSLQITVTHCCRLSINHQLTIVWDLSMINHSHRHTMYILSMDTGLLTTTAIIHLPIINHP